MANRTSHVDCPREGRLFNRMPERPTYHNDRNPQPQKAEKLQKIFEERSGALLRFLRRINNDRPHIVEDLLQETMIKVWRHIDDVPTEHDHVQSWLYTVARNVSTDEARKRQRRPTESQREYDLCKFPALSDPMEVVIATESLLEAYRSLSAERREALREIYLQSRSAADAAKFLSVPVGTAKSRAFYAMASLRSAVLAE